MKILSVTAALPIPGVFENENDVTLKFFSHLKSQVPSISVDHLYPALRVPKIFEKLKKEWGIYNRIFDKKKFIYDDMLVRMCPCFCLRRFNWSRVLTSQSILWMNRQLDNDINFNEYDIVHAQKIFPAGVLAEDIARRFRKPLVFSVRREMDLWDNRFSRAQAKKILSVADAVVSINYRMHELLLVNGIDSRFIPHGLDNFFFDKYMRKTPRVPVRILSLCRLMRLKHLDKVLIALKTLRSAGVDFIYTVAGSGDDELRLRTMTSDLGLSDVVEFIGQVDYANVPQVMKNHDIFVMPSSPEIMGRVYFEAMAQGLPVIGAKHSGIDGFFKNWESGISVDHTSVTNLAKALQCLIEDPQLRKSIGQAGQELVQPFSWDHIVQWYKEIYDDALRESYSTNGRT